MAIATVARRDYSRYDTDVAAMVTSPTLRISVKMLSISAGGAMFRMDRLSSKVFEDAKFTLEIPGIGRIVANKKWRRDTDLGCKFDLTDQDRLRLADRLEQLFGRAPSKMQLASVNTPRP